MKVSKDEAISKLARENFALKEKNKEFKQRLSDINGILFSIGGPLNDNVLKFNNRQLQVFARIRDLSE